MIYPGLDAYCCYCCASQLIMRCILYTCSTFTGGAMQHRLCWQLWGLGQPGSEAAANSHILAYTATCAPVVSLAERCNTGCAGSCGTGPARK